MASYWLRVLGWGSVQGTVFWRARLKVDKVHEKPQWFFGGEK